VVPGGRPRLAGGGERERLAGPGDTVDHLHPSARRAQGPDHRRLLARERRRRVDHRIDKLGASDTDPGLAAPHRGGDETSLDGQHLRGRPAQLVGAGRHRAAIGEPDPRRAVRPGQRDDTIGLEEPVHQAEHVVDPATVREGVAHGLDHVALSERRPSFGQPFGTGQRRKQALRPGRAGCGRIDRR